MANTRVDFTLPTKVTFGSGTLVDLREEISRCGFKRVALITSKDLVELKLAEKVVVATEQGGAKTLIFSRAASNPTTKLVAEGVKELEPFDPDCLVGFGGGSAIDLAKGIGICLSHNCDDIRALQSDQNIRTRSVPVICIPTTSGTGSEVNYWAVISDPRTNEKLSIGDPRMAPHMAIVDPELTLTLPRKITLWTGIDALTHALEAYVSILSNRLSDLLALEGIKLVLESLDRAVNHGEDLAAREGMALASLLAGTAMQNVGLGLIHAMSHQVSGFYDTPHGLTNAKLLAPVFAFNLREVPQEKRTKLDSLSKTVFQDLLVDIDRRYDIIDEVITVRESDLEIMSKQARENINAKSNPRHPQPSEIESLYRSAFTVV
ncbi:MAG: iron-containing alcohol dehydrogenase [Candidatus Bipolaricaulota bacterium]|nr:iron-containing alcohol dehydrogenase [Candidatus Bipolaricaulota bacterium]